MRFFYYICIMNKEQYDKYFAEREKEIEDLMQTDNLSELYSNLARYLRNWNLRNIPELQSYETKLYDFSEPDLSFREFNIIANYLRSVGVSYTNVTLKQISEIVTKDNLLTQRNCGAKSIEKIRNLFNTYGLELK